MTLVEQGIQNAQDRITNITARVPEHEVVEQTLAGLFVQDGARKFVSGNRAAYSASYSSRTYINGSGGKIQDLNDLIANLNNG